MPLGEMKSARLKAAHAVWEEKRGQRLYPARAALAPRDMVSFLANVTLWRRTYDGDYEYRIMGDIDAAAYGCSMIGRYVSDLDKSKPGNGKLVKAVLDHVVRTKAPCVSDGWFVTSQGRPVRHEMLFLPLGPDEATVDHILGVSVHTAD